VKGGSWSGFATKWSAPVNTEMQGQPTPTIDIRQQVLAVSPRCNEFRAVQAIDERLHTELAQDALVLHDDSIDRLAQSVSCEHAFESLDVG
jgi:hypothetical protein